MKVTAVVRTEWLIARVMRQLRRIPGIVRVYRDMQTPRLCTVIASLSDTDRYEFYFSRYSGRCGVVKIYRRHPYTEVITLRGDHAEALRTIERAHLPRHDIPEKSG